MNPNSLGRLNRVIGLDEEAAESSRLARSAAENAAGAHSGHAAPPRLRPGEGAPRPAEGRDNDDERRRDLERVCLRAEREGAAGWAKVIPKLRAYTEAFPREPQAWAHLARARASQGEEADAVRAAQEASKLDPNASLGPAVSTLVARASAKAGNWESVAKHAEAALASQPSDAEALELLVWALVSKSQPQRAEDTLAVLAQGQPERATAVAKKLASRVSGVQERHRWLSRACQWAKGADRPMQDLAEVCLVLERATEAMQWYREYFTQKGGAVDPEVANTLVQLCVRSGRNEEALEVYRKAISASPGRFELQRGYGQLLLKQGRTGEAIEAIRSGASSAPTLQEAAGMHIMLAELLQSMGQPREAMRSWEAAAALDDGSVAAWRGLYNAAVLAGVDVEQLRAVSQLARLEPHNADWSAKLRSLEDRGARPDGATSAIRGAVAKLQEFNPGEAQSLLRGVESPSQEVQAWMGYTQLLLGNTERAVNSLQAALRGASDSPKARLYLALALADRGDDQAAKQEFASAVKSHPVLQRLASDSVLQDALNARSLERAGLAKDFPGAGQRLAKDLAMLAADWRQSGAKSAAVQERAAGVLERSPSGAARRAPESAGSLPKSVAQEEPADAWRDTLAENQAVEVYSKSAGKWLAGKVKQVMPEMVKIKYLIDGQWCEKVLLRSSDSLRVVREEPAAAGAGSAAFSPPPRSGQANDRGTGPKGLLPYHVGSEPEVAMTPKKDVIQPATPSSSDYRGEPAPRKAVESYDRSPSAATAARPAEKGVSELPEPRGGAPQARAERRDKSPIRPSAAATSSVPDGGRSPRRPETSSQGGTTPQAEQRPPQAVRRTTNVGGVEVDTAELLNIEELQLGKKLGTGGFGAVFHGRYRGAEVAVKKLHIADGQVTQMQVDEFKKEVANLQALRHTRLVSFIGAALQPPHSLCIVTEFMPNGSLYDLLHQRKQFLEWQKRLSVSSQVVEGVGFLHCRHPPFVHRDLKSLNVVMDFSLNAKLCDFGLTQSMEKTHISRRDNEGGSPRYMAPELFDSKGKITEKVDIWATGALVLEVFTSRLPHEECNSLQQVMTKTLIQRECPFLDWRDVQPDLKILAEKCFIFEPHGRIDARGLLEGLRNLRPG